MVPLIVRRTPRIVPQGAATKMPDPTAQQLPAGRGKQEVLGLYARRSCLDNACPHFTWSQQYNVFINGRVLHDPLGQGIIRIVFEDADAAARFQERKNVLVNQMPGRRFHMVQHRAQHDQIERRGIEGGLGILDRVQLWYRAS